MEDKNSLFDFLYYDTANTTAFSGRDKIVKAARIINPNISNKDFERWFQKQHVNVHKTVRRRFVRPKTFCKGPNEQFQIDLIDYQKFQSSMTILIIF